MAYKKRGKSGKAYNPLPLGMVGEKYALSIKNKTIYGPDMQPIGKATPKQLAYMSGVLDGLTISKEIHCLKNGKPIKGKTFRKKRK